MDKAIYTCLKQDILTAMNVLTKEERDVINLTFGVNGFDMSGVSKLSDICNISKNKVRRTTGKALQKLRCLPVRIKLREYLE